MNDKAVSNWKCVKQVKGKWIIVSGSFPYVKAVAKRSKGGFLIHRKALYTALIAELLYGN